MENNPYEVDVKTIQSFKTEDYTEYEKMFKSMDTDKSGFIEKGELLKVMHNLGYRSMVEEDLTKIWAEIDLNKDQKVSFKEYFMMMKKVKREQGSTQEAFTNKAGKEFIKVGTDFSFFCWRENCFHQGDQHSAHRWPGLQEVPTNWPKYERAVHNA